MLGANEDVHQMLFFHNELLLYKVNEIEKPGICGQKVSTSFNLITRSTVAI